MEVLSLRRVSLGSMLHGKASMMHYRAFAAHVQTTAPFGKARPARRPTWRRAAEPSPQEAAEMQKAMQAAMKDPQARRSGLPN